MLEGNKTYFKLVKGKHSQIFKIQTEARGTFSSYCVGMINKVNTEDAFTLTATALSIKGLCVAAVLGHLSLII